MTERIKNLLELLKSEKYKEKRYSKVVEMDEKSKSASEYVKSSLLLEKALENETPNLFLNDRRKPTVKCLSKFLINWVTIV